MRLLKPFHPYILSASLLSKFKTQQSVHDRIEDKEDEDPNDGWVKLKNMYSYGPTQLPSPQFGTITEGTFTSFLMGFVIGSMKDSRETYLNFVETNRTTAFRHHLEAKRALQDRMILALAKGGWRLGWRMGLISGSFITLILSAHTYRGYSSVTEFSLAGAISCGLYKFLQGPKATISGAAVGGAMGTAVGVIIVGFMKITGTSFDDMYTNEADKIKTYYDGERKKVEELRKKEFPDIEYRQTQPLHDINNDQMDKMVKENHKNVESKEKK